jgi:hypothetical protein
MSARIAPQRSGAQSTTISASPQSIAARVLAPIRVCRTARGFERLTHRHACGRRNWSQPKRESYDQGSRKRKKHNIPIGRDVDIDAGPRSQRLSGGHGEHPACRSPQANEQKLSVSNWRKRLRPLAQRAIRKPNSRRRFKLRAIKSRATFEQAITNTSATMHIRK